MAPLETWTEEEMTQFEKAYCQVGKRFHLVASAVSFAQRRHAQPAGRWALTRTPTVAAARFHLSRGLPVLSSTIAGRRQVALAMFLLAARPPTHGAGRQTRRGEGICRAQKMRGAGAGASAGPMAPATAQKLLTSAVR
jgi:hypothetical protein